MTRVALVTGASRGIGKAIALTLAEAGLSVGVNYANNDVAAKELAASIRDAGGSALAVGADVGDTDQVDAMFDAVHEELGPVVVLVNNAGIIPRKRGVTEDGLETQFAVNHVAYFLLTNLLLDTLKASAPARVVNVSSQVHNGASIDFDDLQSKHSYRPTRVYAWTKLANVLFTYELARRLEGGHVTGSCLHPGTVATNLLGDYLPSALRDRKSTRLNSSH